MNQHDLVIHALRDELLPVLPDTHIVRLSTVGGVRHGYGLEVCDKFEPFSSPAIQFCYWGTTLVVYYMDRAQDTHSTTKYDLADPHSVERAVNHCLRLLREGP